MKTRLELMAKLAEYLRSSNPDFDQAYPHRWLPGTEDDGEYIQEEVRPIRCYNFFDTLRR